MAEENTSNERDEPVTPWDPETDPDGYTQDDVSRKDWYLDTVLNVVHGFRDDHDDGVIGLTVVSAGAVVSGLAISRAAWIAGIVDQYKQAGADETVIAQLFHHFHDRSVQEAKRRDDAELPSAARSFLHMKNVHVGTATAYIEVPLWRGALTDITGWSLGSWNPAQSPGAE